MDCAGEPASGADLYEQILREYFADQDLPTFDLILLGLGTDGHTASLFPGTEILDETQRWVAPVYVPALNSWRISLTLPAINAASHVAFLVSGGEKAAVLKHILEYPDELRYPAQKVVPQSALHWFTDQAASRMLNDLTG
jgi:6-phosphogluconolactonase